MTSQDILDKFPQIESVKVSKRFPRTIILEVKERSPFAVFCRTDGGKCFRMDENGTVFEELGQAPENVFIVRQLMENEEISVGQKVVEKNIMDIISKVKKNLGDNFQIDIREAAVLTPYRLNMETAENWQIYFNIDSEIDLQIAKMNLLLKDEISLNIRKTLQYIDLRFRDKAYYK